MADEMTKPPYSRPAIVPAKHGWDSLLKVEGDDLETHYRHCLDHFTSLLRGLNTRFAFLL